MEHSKEKCCVGAALAILSPAEFIRYIQLGILYKAVSKTYSEIGMDLPSADSTLDTALPSFYKYRTPNISVDICFNRKLWVSVTTVF